MFNIYDATRLDKIHHYVLRQNDKNFFIDVHEQIEEEFNLEYVAIPQIFGMFHCSVYTFP